MPQRKPYNIDTKDAIMKKYLLIILVLFLSVGVKAQSAEVEKLKAEIELLKVKIESLELKYELLKQKLDVLNTTKPTTQANSQSLISTPTTTTPTTQKKPEASGQCKATTKKGSRCSRSAGSNGYCWQHGG